MDNYVVAVDGLENIGDIAELDERILRKARQAINSTVRRTRTAAARDIQAQVNFPARYLVNQKSSRLFISEFAEGRSLRAVIQGSERATSLARFASNKSPESARRQGGVSVEVAPGQRKFMKKAFLLRLPAGSTLTDTQNNLGLAIRLREGSLANKKNLVKVGKGLYVLYGPSVNQVFRSVAEDVAPDAANWLEREFVRLMEL